tara:strand:+ start:191 stop:496 length:306 start_codon:yes stop_codon:yes gene_type:complete
MIIDFKTYAVQEEAVTRLPEHLETPASNDKRDWYKHAISLCDLQYQHGGVCVLGPIPKRLPRGEVLVVNVRLPPLFLRYLSQKMRKGARLHMTWTACQNLW